MKNKIKLMILPLLLTFGSIITIAYVWAKYIDDNKKSQTLREKELINDSLAKENKELLKKVSETTESSYNQLEQSSKKISEINQDLVNAKDVINQLKSETVEELKGGDIPFAFVNLGGDKGGGYIEIVVTNYRELPIYSIGVEYQEPIRLNPIFDWTEHTDFGFKREERNVLHLYSKWLCCGQYIPKTDLSEFILVYNITWRLGKYQMGVTLKRADQERYEVVKSEFYYKRSVYSEEEFLRLATGENKKLKPPLPHKSY